MADKDQAIRHLEKPLSQDSQIASHQEEVMKSDQNGNSTHQDWTDMEEKQLV